MPRKPAPAVVDARTKPAPASADSGHTLGTLIERLQPAVLDVAVAPNGLDVTVGAPVIVDPAESSASAGAVALAVGVDSDRERIAMLRRLGEGGAAAAVVKQSGALSDAVLAAAADAGVAVLVAPAALSWGQLYSLLLTAASATPAVPSQVSAAPLGDLFALANAIAAAVGGATTIEDATNRVLAYSNLGHPIDPARQETILGRQVPSGWIQRLQEAGVFRRLWQTDEVVRIADFADEDRAYLSRTAVAVRAGGELLGSVWVIEGDQPLGPEAERTLRDAGEIAALHLLRHRTATDVDRQRRAEALLALLAGTDRGGVAVNVLGIAADRPTAVIAFAVRDAGDAGGASVVVAAQRVADVAAVYCESYRRQAACAASGERVYVLVPVDTDLDATPAVGLADAVVERAGQALRLRLQAGVGSAVSSLEGVARARREADEVLDVLVELPEQSVATIGGLRAKVILHRLRDLAARDRDLVAGQVSAL